MNVKQAQNRQLPPQFEIEYSEIAATFRQGFTLIFEIAKGFLLLNAILFSGLAFLKEPKGLATLILACVGVFLSIGASVIHRRISGYVRTYMERGAELEKDLDMAYFSRILGVDKKSSWLRSYYVMLGFYSLFFSFWLIVLLRVTFGQNVTFSFNF